MLIANPIYDAVFKYLMDDLPVAKVILSTVVGREIEELEFKQRERSAQVASLGVTIFRLDFSAVIKTADGERKNVLIEIQKADSGEDIGRFRRYLAENYYTPPPPKMSKPPKGLPGERESHAFDGLPEARSETTAGETPGEVFGEAPGEGALDVQEQWPAVYAAAPPGANAPLLPI